MGGSRSLATPTRYARNDGSAALPAETSRRTLAQRPDAAAGGSSAPRKMATSSTASSPLPSLYAAHRKTAERATGDTFTAEPALDVRRLSGMGSSALP